MAHQLVGKEFHVVVVGTLNGVFLPRLGSRFVVLCHLLDGVASNRSVDGPFAPSVTVAGRETVFRNGFSDGVFFFLDQFINQPLLCIGTHLADALFVTAKDGRHEKLLTVLVSHQQSGFVVARLVAIIDDVGGIVCKLFFLAEIAVMHDGVDVADGAIEANLVEVVETAGVVQVEQAAIFEGLG